jgi:hypothetical protein
MLYLFVSQNTCNRRSCWFPSCGLWTHLYKSEINLNVWSVRKSFIPTEDPPKNIDSSSLKRPHQKKEVALITVTKISLRASYVINCMSNRYQCLMGKDLCLISVNWHKKCESPLLIMLVSACTDKVDHSRDICAYVHVHASQAPAHARFFGQKIRIEKIRKYTKYIYHSSHHVGEECLTVFSGFSLFIFCSLHL